MLMFKFENYYLKLTYAKIFNILCEYLILQSGVPETCEWVMHQKTHGQGRH